MLGPYKVESELGVTVGVRFRVGVRVRVVVRVRDIIATIMWICNHTYMLYWNSSNNKLGPKPG